MPTTTTTKIVEILLPNPGLPNFFAKNADITYGLDRNASNYIAVVPVSSGLALIDMHAVVLAFAAGSTMLPSSAATIITYATGGTSRTIEVGGGYAISASYSSTTATSGLAIINLKSKTVRYLKGVCPGASKFQWAPYFADELDNQLTSLSDTIVASTYSTNTSIESISAALASLKEQLQALQENSPTHYDKTSRKDGEAGIIIGSIALCFSLASVVLAFVLTMHPAGATGLSHV